MQIILIVGLRKKVMQIPRWYLHLLLVFLVCFLLLSFCVTGGFLSYWFWRAEVLQKHASAVNQTQDLQDVITRLADVEAIVSQGDSIANYLIRSTHTHYIYPVSTVFSLPDALSFADKASVLNYADILMVRANEAYTLLGNIRRVLVNQHATEWLMPSLRPVQHAYLSSGFGPRINPFTGKVEFHRGCDFAAPQGTPIQAAATGVVSYAGPRAGYGNMVAVDHSHGYTTVYAHCSKILVHVGELVHQGGVVALVGSTGRSTGPHVHFEVRHLGVAQDPLLFLQHLPKESTKTAVASTGKSL